MIKDFNSQEKFWKGNFGNKYIKRNDFKKGINNNVHLFKKIFKKSIKIKDLIELGPNIGHNTLAIKKIFRKVKITGVEINKKACQELKKIKNVDVINESILSFNTDNKFDLVLAKGILIHIHPKYLKNLYKKIYKLSKKYILFCEYYNPYPVSIKYRGHKEKLFKNDYAGDFLKMFKDYKLEDYGFIYHLDKYPSDDVTWFLLKKVKK